MRISMEIDTKSFLYTLNYQIQEALNIAIGPGMSYLRKKFIEKLKTQYYSLEQLRQLGHPYALRRFVAFNIKVKKLQKFRSSMERNIGASTVRIKMYGKLAGKVKTDIINKQSGRLLHSVSIKYRRGYLPKTNKSTVKSIKGYKVEAAITIPSSKVKYAYYVFMGTSKLIPRPIHYIVAKREQYNMAKVMEKEMQKYFDSIYTSVGPGDIFK